MKESSRKIMFEPMESFLTSFKSNVCFFFLRRKIAILRKLNSEFTTYNLFNRKLLVGTKYLVVSAPFTFYACTFETMDETFGQKYYNGYGIRV